MSYQAYKGENDRDWLVFFHGIGGNHTIFKKQIDFFKGKFHLLFIDLPGHGASANVKEGEDLLKVTSVKVIELLDRLNITKAHFIGVSLGTIIMQDIAIRFPHRIKSMVLAGAVGKWLWWGTALGKLTLSYPIRHILPYMLPYTSFAYLLMPQKNHKKSRDIFIREAKKLGKSSYLHWSYVLRDAYRVYHHLRERTNEIPKLYVSGEEDHMFLRGITHHVHREKAAELVIIQKCGHVCHIERTAEFNKVSLDFFMKNS